MKQKKSMRLKLAPSSLDLDLKSSIHSHTLFFDRLIDLIPARFYLPAEDENKVWFHGLSKAARAAARKQARENIKKSRRDRLDPDKSSTTLDLLQKSLKPDELTESTCVDGDTEADTIHKPLPSKESEQSMTYEALREKLRRRLEELRGNRPDKSEMERRKGPMQKKRKRNGPEGKSSKEGSGGRGLGVSALKTDVAFSQVKLGDGDGKGKNKKLSKLQVLERAKKLEEAKKDPEKGESLSKKHSWKAAVSRAAGIKVHDDPKLLKESIKKEKRRHQKNVQKWKERVESREKTRAEKQQIRSGNIAERIQQKKKRKIEKREKKLMRPGFEGRKEGFINAN